MVRSLETESNIPLELLKVDGGAARSDFLLQFQADLLGVPVERPAGVELTARGVAYFCWVSNGLLEGFTRNSTVGNHYHYF